MLKKEGEYNISIKNVGNSELRITGHALIEGSPVAFTAQMLLVVMRMIVLVLSTRPCYNLTCYPIVRWRNCLQNCFTG